MAKKRRSSPKKRTAASSNTNAVVEQLTHLLVAIVFVFLILSTFNSAGVLGSQLNGLLRVLVGGATVFLAAPLVWGAGRYFFPKRVGFRLPSAIGAILAYLGFVGILHVTSNATGGVIGAGIADAITGALGQIVGILLLAVLLVGGVMLTFDRAVLTFIRATSEADHADDEADYAVPEAAKVPVKELQAGTLRRIQEKLKPTQLKVDEPKGARPVVARQTDANWAYPPLTLLESLEMRPQAGNIQKRMELIQKTLADFGIDVTMTDVCIGPTVTQYQLKPADGVKLNQITARTDDLALALAAESLRVEAPIPGKGLVGVELPNEKKAIVGLKDVLKSQAFQRVGSKLGVVLGLDAAGQPAVADLTRAPHLLIAGSTGSGKSVMINTVILSLLMSNSPDELRLILVDPKRVELAGYNGLPHLITPVITEPRDTVIALKRCVEEMERRYKLLQTTGARNIEQYNSKPDLTEGKLPYIVVIIDELADLMMASAREVEAKIVRLAQMARAVGIHLIVATQRPSVDVITGLIKANIPARIAFAVTSQIDSRTIIDSPGAEKLLGYGDMLFMSTESPKPRRVQGAFSSDKEIQNVIAHIRMQEPGNRYDPSFLEDSAGSRFGAEGGSLDPEEEMLLQEAHALFVKHNKASTSMLQTYLRVGYNKAKRIVAALEERGLIGPERGGKQREVYRQESAEAAVPVAELSDDIGDIDRFA